MLLTLMGVACIGAGFNFAFSGFLVSETKQDNAAMLQQARALAAETAASLQALPLKDAQRHILATAQLPIAGTPFSLPPEGTDMNAQPATHSGQSQLLYSGYVLVGKEALAIIDGLEYAVGDTLPGTGDQIRAIRNDGIVLFSPARNAEWVLPYSGDDL